MPRFTDLPHRPPPATPARWQVDVSIEGEVVASIDDAAFEGLGQRDHEADFRCVTSWSVTALTWTGVALRSVLASVGIEEPPLPYLAARAADKRKATLLWEDAVAADVILATHLDGEALGDRHGGPVRLVAPRLYGYKSVKHLQTIDFRATPPPHLGKEHLRGRVALEERHPTLPTWLVKVPYRLAIPPTAYIAERTLRRHQGR